MEGERFDQLARSIGVQISRRIALGPLAGLGLGGLFAIPAKADAQDRNRRNRRRARRRRERRDSEGIRYYEDLTAALVRAGGDCEALVAAASTFQARNKGRFRRVMAQEARRGQDRVLARRYRQRVTAASASLHAMLATCGFRGSTPAQDSLLCDLPSADAIGPPAQGTCHGCDCGCICPLSPGQCTLSFFGCAFGGPASRPNCCWFGTCVNHLCLEQCPNCCNCCPSVA